jgi:SET domain-containing protein
VTRLPRLVRRHSKISGWGVFAGEDIKKGARIVQYKGELIAQSEAWRREQGYLKRQRIWIFSISDRWAVDAAYGGNVARYVNHSCRPNCYSDTFGREVWILAGRRIRKGEELTYDYNTEGIASIKCLCRPGCKRIL